MDGVSRPSPQSAAATSAIVSGAPDLSALKKGYGDGRRILDVTEQTFQTDVVDRSMHVLVVIDLWSTSCGRCTRLSPVLERLAEAAGGAWVLAKVDHDANPRIAQLLTSRPDGLCPDGLCLIFAFAGGETQAIYSSARPADVGRWITVYLDQARDQIARARAGVLVDHRGRDLHRIPDAAQAAPSDDAKE